MRRILTSLTTVGLIAAAATIVHAQTVRPLSVQVVDQRGMPLRNAVVTVYPAAGTGGRAYVSVRRPAVAQRDRAFLPGTLIVARGSTVAFPNLDTVRHSVYSFSPTARFQFDLYGQDQSRSHVFPVAGTVAIGCNIHDDMRGYIKVVDTPFAVQTDANGLARVAGLPAGSLSVRVWHPQLQARSQEQAFTVGANGVSTRLVVTARGARL